METIVNKVFRGELRNNNSMANHNHITDTVTLELRHHCMSHICGPYKIAYRTRNEFLMYAVNRQKLAPDSQLRQSLDEMTSMKILSRIEGDEERTRKVLNGLKDLVEEKIVSPIPPAEEGKPTTKSISATKIEEMLGKLKSSSFTSYWT